MYFTEKLITEVRKYPCIWDQSVDGYKDNDVKSACWFKVAEAMYSDDWADLEYGERKEKATELKSKKWRHIRDGYLKYITEEDNMKSGSQNTNKKPRKKPYTHAKLLTFLSVILKRKRRTNVNYEKEDNTSIAEHSLNDTDDNDMCDAALEVSHLPTPTIKNRNPDEKLRLTPFQNNLIEHLRKKEESESRSEFSPDQTIVMSFLPYLKKLNDEQKLDFQLNGLQYLQQIIKHQPCPQNPLSTAQHKSTLDPPPSNHHTQSYEQNFEI